MIPIKTVCGAIRAVRTDGKFVVTTHRIKVLLTGIVCVVILSLVPGCRKSAQELAEQNAIARHNREAQQIKAFRKLMSGPDAHRVYQGFNFLARLGHDGQLPGISRNSHGRLGLDKPPAVTPNGPYYWSQEFRVTTQDTPSRICHYVLVQTYSNSDFQLQKAWRSDAGGKVLEEYPIAPAPTMLGVHTAFLGPANPGAEIGFADWNHSILGGGSVSIDTDDPDTGLGCFKIGITNADSSPTNRAAFRSEIFPLQTGGKLGGPLTFSFAYKLPDPVKPGDNLEVHFRYFDGSRTNFLGEKVILVGSSTVDSEMTRYKTITVNSLVVPREAVNADIRVVANFFGPWTSGTGQFDDFSVTTEPRRWWKIFF